MKSNAIKKSGTNPGSECFVYQTNRKADKDDFGDLIAQGDIGAKVPQ
jgi:hypothetical protein